MKLKELVGIKKLDAVDFSTESIKNWGDDYEDCCVCRFRLDGIVYVAVEDPDDGYRSSMKDLAIDDSAKMKNVFPQIDVRCEYRGKSNEYDGADVLELVDIKTEGIVLEVGTENTDDYYPWFTAKFHPKTICLNSAS